MKDKELKLNASGYYDEPCYKAITAPPKPGEIWLHGTSGHFLLVIANQNGVCSTIRLVDQEKEGSNMVTGTVPMYAKPIMLGYCFEHMLQSYVKTVKDEEFEKMKRGSAFALGLQNVKATDMPKEDNERDAQQHTINDLVKANAELLEERDKLLEEIAGYGETIKRQSGDLHAKDIENTNLRTHLAQQSIEAASATIYKEMYMTLLDKVIAARGCVNE